MKKFYLISGALLILLSCSRIIHHNPKHQFCMENIYEKAIDGFGDIPPDLLNNLNKMGLDERAELNDLEAQFLNTEFNTNSFGVNLRGQKICFLRNSSLCNKIDYFQQTKSRYKHQTSLVGGCTLYIFNPTQKEQTGYDAAVNYWCKFIIPMDDVVKQIIKLKTGLHRNHVIPVKTNIKEKRE